MVTTLVSAKPIRDELVSIYGATSEWKAVFGYYPSNKELDGRWPFLVIVTVGDSLEMEGVEKNPATFDLILHSFVATTPNSDVWASEEAMDMTDDLNQIIKQTIRNDVTANGVADNLLFPSPASISNQPYHKVPYLVTMRVLRAYYSSGGAS